MDTVDALVLAVCIWAVSTVLTFDYAYDKGRAGAQEKCRTETTTMAALPGQRGMTPNANITGG